MEQGTILAESGAVLTPGRIGLLAAAGFGRLRVGRQPVVGVLATGSELTEPGQPLAPGRIYESNRPALAALMERVGAVPKTLPLVADVLAGTSQALAEAFNQYDALVTSGGVSVGEMDFLKRAFNKLMLNYTWWVNRKDRFGKNVFEGGFLGLDNIGVFDRSARYSRASL